ncbi:DMT family transporter [Neoroseomonas lacus]|uniref:EamA domain-containing protein n=1 Tax=Neoroseomonas lacus TaxID=287609 RepID=A0A917KTT9_9PROT|nr:DMT family transporter [Neoroseomonas lacus]GGJ29612.1 hypothetical protein GCM10011320_41240 [Neoroseomonas lacus]
MTAVALRRAGRAAGLTEWAGFAWGFLAATIWGAYLAFARAGVVAGVSPLDFAMLRFVTAGAVMLPVLLRLGLPSLAGVGWPRGLMLTLQGGPAFILVGTLGYRYAPLAHGAVAQPGTAVIGTMLLAVLLLGERVTPLRWFGAALVVAGLTIVAGGFVATGGAWRGDLCFIAAGGLWAAFTVTCRVWQVDPLRSTAIISVVGGVAVVPVWLAVGDGTALLAQGVGALVVQAVVQGVLSGVVAVFAYGRAVARLGAARSAIFAAMVPALAMLAGVPVAGEWPSAVQWAGLAVVLAGLSLAMGVVRPR